jgi:alginate O-acetyltransferase complex protein AlgJ
VLLLGDSHNLIFHEGGDMLATGAGLPDQLALELGFPVDLIGVRGSGATPARVNLLRRARANPDYLRKKKLIIWCFSAREFTESSGWQKVPVVR